MPEAVCQEPGIEKIKAITKAEKKQLLTQVPHWLVHQVGCFLQRQKLRFTNGRKCRIGGKA